MVCIKPIKLLLKKKFTSKSICFFGCHREHYLKLICYFFHFLKVEILQRVACDINTVEYITTFSVIIVVTIITYFKCFYNNQINHNNKYSKEKPIIENEDEDKTTAVISNDNDDIGHHRRR